MALHWEFTNDENRMKMRGGVQDAFIWGCLFVGIGTISDANKDEWRTRYTMMVKMHGCLLAHKNEETGEEIEWIPSPEEMDLAVGLRTNVGQKEHISKWANRQFKSLKEKCVRERKEYEKEKADATAVSA